MMEANEVFNEHERKKENEAEVHARIQVAGREACIGGPSCGGGGTGIGDRGEPAAQLTRHRLTEGGGALQVEQAAEIARLKRALAHKEEEAAILKKAMAYFVRESR